MPHPSPSWTHVTAIPLREAGPFLAHVNPPVPRPCIAVRSTSLEQPARGFGAAVTPRRFGPQSSSRGVFVQLQPRRSTDVKNRVLPPAPGLPSRSCWPLVVGRVYALPSVVRSLAVKRRGGSFRYCRGGAGPLEGFQVLPLGGVTAVGGITAVRGSTSRAFFIQ